MSKATGHSKRRAWRADVKLSMTPMIDVVFLLLVFFVVTIRPLDTLSALTVARPQGEDKAIEVQLPRIVVGVDGYTIAGQRISLPDLNRKLARIRSSSPAIHLIVACTAQAPHSSLVRLLNTCASLDITNISLFSM